MKRENHLVVLLSMMVVLALLAACSAPEPTATTAPKEEPSVVPTDTLPAPSEASAAITVTFAGDECVIDAPERVPAGRIPIVLDVRDQTAHESYGVQILTMDEGHTLEELVSYQQEISFPLWAHDHGFITAAQGTTQERTIVLFEGPLYLACFTNTADGSQAEYAGISGSIEIEPAASSGGWEATQADEASAAITVTFEGDECVYHGPERIPAGEISLTLDVRDQSDHEKYWVLAYTLEEGKTVEDLRAWKSVGHSPLWVDFHGMLDEQPAGTMEETTIILFEGPLFLACVTEPPGYITDVLGPLEIEPAAGFPSGRFVAENDNWVLVFDDDGSFIFPEFGQLSASGTYSIEGYELTWETDSYCGLGTGKPTYTWSFENDTLLFQVQGNDECSSRLGVLDNVAYHRE